MLTVKAPVTLVLAGEWASREEGNNCIASAINKSIIVTVESSEETTIHAPSLGVESCLLFSSTCTISSKKPSQQQLFNLIKNVISTTFTYLKNASLDIKPVALTINTDNISITQKNGEVQWVDLNIKAAVGVALVKALLLFHEQNVTNASGKQQIFKIAFLALYGMDNDQQYGSDIAASAYGTTVLYQHTSFTWVTKQLAAHQDNIQTIVDKQWPDLKISPFHMPDDLKLCVCFVDQQKPTDELVKKIEVYKAAYPIRYKQLCASINLIVKDLAVAIQKNDKMIILELVKQNKQLLKHLLEEAGNSLETPALNTLISCAEECGAAAKFAGTSDTGYGFALCLDRFTAQKVKRKWEKKGMQMLNTQILG